MIDLMTESPIDETMTDATMTDETMTDETMTDATVTDAGNDDAGNDHIRSATGSEPGPGAANISQPPPPPPTAPRPARRLVRDPNTRLGGVASGLAHYLDWDVSVVRMLIVLFALTTGTGFVAYLVAWIVIPAANVAIQPTPVPPVAPWTQAARA